MASLTSYMSNKLLDWLFRGQAFTPPATYYAALFTVNPTIAGGGTEVTGGAYARVPIAASLVNFAGTQGAGTTVASTGTSGLTSNNGVITFPTPTALWGAPVTGIALMDIATLGSGNMCGFAALTNSKNINNGDPAPSFPAAALTFTLL